MTEFEGDSAFELLKGGDTYTEDSSSELSLVQLITNNKHGINMRKSLLVISSNKCRCNVCI